MTKRAWKALGIVLAVLLVSSIAVAAQPGDTEPEPINTEPINTLRVYGRSDENAAFPYQTVQGPFDLRSYEAPPKDFVVWNPAYLDHWDQASNEIYGDFFFDIQASGFDAHQKVHLRHWYVPYYEEPAGKTWVHQDGVAAPEGTIVFEYTYILLDVDTHQPVAGEPGSTQFAFPIGDTSDAALGGQIGLDDWDVFIREPGETPEAFITLVNSITGWDTPDVVMDISTKKLMVEPGDELVFLDHRIVIKDIVGTPAPGTPGVQIDLYYNGEADHLDPSRNVLGENVIVLRGDTLSAGRHEFRADGAPESVVEPWYLEVRDVFGDDAAQIVLGRLMTEGESFFVDGAEYAVAKIHAPGGNFKYITIRNSLPKYDEVDLDQLSVIKLPVQPNESLPFLPPFNMTHDIIDDVNATLDTTDMLPDEQDLELAGAIIGRRVEDQLPVDAYFIRQAKEGRFDTSLLEEKFTHPAGTWQWIHIETHPWNYTEFVLPEIDGLTDGDYILVSSFITEDSGAVWSETEYTDAVRVKFYYDAAIGKVNSADVYVNDAIYNELYYDWPEGLEPANSLRVYGKAGYNANFPYVDLAAPFDLTHPEAPPKDFIVFNPAWHSYLEDVVVSGADANQKVHLRQWYVPDYCEPCGDVWGPVTPQCQDEIVKEYTYILLDRNNDPKLGTPGLTPATRTRFYFPVASNDPDQIGLDSYDYDGDLTNDLVYLAALGLVDGGPFDGDRFVDLSTGRITVGEGDVIQFLDHKFEILQIDWMQPAPRVVVQVYYTGNRADQAIGQLTVLGDQTGSAGRKPATVLENTLPEVVFRPGYLTVSAVLSNDQATVEIGRLLKQGEAFYVDGAEYCVARLGGHFANTDDDALLYITLRNGLPKYDEVRLGGELSITKHPVQAFEALPFLPPFNMDHIMVNDIDGSGTSGAPDEQGSDNVGGLTGDIADRLVPRAAIVEYFIAETYEPRFDTTLGEEKFTVPVMEELELVAKTLADAQQDEVRRPEDGQGWLSYFSCGSEFTFQFDGMAPLTDTEYVLIYYADIGDTGVWADDHEAVCLAGPVLSDDGGHLHLPGSLVTGALPFHYDHNADPLTTTYDDGSTGAKIWLVPADRVDCAAGTMAGLGWAPDEILFETELINYDPDGDCVRVQEWMWINIETNPQKYTEFVLPEGDLYLLVSSWMTQDSTDVWYEMPEDAVRMKFVHNPSDGTGIYVNTLGVEAPEPCVPPVITNVTAVPEEQLLGEAIAFAAWADGTDPTFTWAFGDGTTETGAYVEKVYQSTGSFIVTLTVEACGETVQETLTVKVVDCKPANLISLESNSPRYLSQTMSFIATVAGDDLSYAWDFGDAGAGTLVSGGQATGEYQFAAIGTYLVELTITSPCLDSSDSKSIEVDVITIDGDVNGDCVVDIFDVMLVVNAWGTEEGDADWDPTFDLNGDGVVDLLDIMFVVVRMTNTCPQ